MSEIGIHIGNAVPVELGRAIGIGQDGKVNEENLKAALNKVLEDVPGLKPQAAGTTGFVQVGAASGNAGAGQAQQATQTQQTGVPAKRWNRWNN